MAIKTFTTGEVLTASDTNTYLANAGLVYVGSTSFSNATFAQLSNVFTSTYDNYRIIFSSYNTTASPSYSHFQLTSAGTPATSNYFSKSIWWSMSAAGGTAVDHDYRNDRLCLGPLGIDPSEPLLAAIDVSQPFLAKSTQMTGNTTGSFYTAYYAMTINGGVNTNATSYDGIKFFATAGNVTGTITVYGYRKA